jgi:hypothetical protein
MVGLEDLHRYLQVLSISEPREGAVADAVAPTDIGKALAIGTTG